MDLPSLDGMNGNADQTPNPSPNEPQYLHPSKVPPHIARMIDAHKNGQGLIPMFVDPTLAKELQDEFGPTGHVVAHNLELHGPFGHSIPDQGTPDLPSDQAPAQPDNPTGQ